MMLKCGEKNNNDYTFGKVEKKIKLANKTTISSNFCTACGTKLNKNVDFCSKCGSPI